MKIVEVPSKDNVGVINAAAPPQVELDIDVKVERGRVILRITNPNATKVEVDNGVELYEHAGFWRRIETGIVFLDRRIVLIPGETVEQVLPLELPPGRYKLVKVVYVDGAKVRVEKEFRV